MNEDCIFCQIARHEIPAQIEYENDEFIAFRDIHPKAPIHILIIPKKHLTSVAELKDNDQDLIGSLILRARDIAQAKGLKNGFRLVSNSGPDAGQIIFHLHFHLLGGQRLGDIA